MLKSSEAKRSSPLHEAQENWPRRYNEDEGSDNDEYDSASMSPDSLLIQAQTEYISHRYTKAIDLLKEAVSKGSARAAFNIGCIYQTSSHAEVPVDHGLASCFYIRALELAMLEVDGGSGCGSDLLDATISL